MMLVRCINELLVSQEDLVTEEKQQKNLLSVIVARENGSNKTVNSLKVL